MRTKYPPHLSDPELWSNLDDCKATPRDTIYIDFFWFIDTDGEADLAYGDPFGNSVYAQGAGDAEGLHSEDVGDFEWFAWLECPKKD